MSTPRITLDRLNDLIAKAQRAGADQADAIFISGKSLSLSQRLGNPEHLERAEGQDIGLRVLIGKRQAIVSSSDTSDSALDELLDRAVSMARVVPEDPFCGLADPAQLARDLPDLDMYDPYEPSAETLIDWATRAEDAARAIKGVTNSEGANASWGENEVAIAATNGFSRTYISSGGSLSASVIAGEGTAMERDYDFSSAVYADDLRRPEDIGRCAGVKAVARLNPRKAKTGQFPIIFDPRVSGSFLGHMASAINGSTIARGTSFLKDKMGEQIFAEAITIVDDPHRKRGLRSKPCDGEGVANRKHHLIDKGRLTTWVLDLRSARQLGLETTGHAARGISSPPSPSVTNLYMEAGHQTPKELMSDISDGLYVCEMIGFGVNGVTGDYSRGAAGFWIENGEIAYPVSELTIAGHLLEMFKKMTAANDLEFRFGTNAPTVRIDGMTIAGQ